MNFVIPYAAIYLADVGITDPFKTNVYITLCILAGTSIGSILCQDLGRRLTLLTGYFTMAVCMLIIATVATGLGSESAMSHRVLVAFLCIWTFIFGAFNASAVWVTAVEQHAVRLRTYGQAFTMAMNFIFNFAVQFWTPYQISPEYGNWGTNLGYFYFGLLIIWFTLTYLSLPETGNLTLEQIDDYYSSSIKPWHTSLKKNKKL